MTSTMLDGLDDDRRMSAQQALRATMQSHQTADGVLYDAAVWLVTAIRR